MRPVILFFLILLIGNIFAFDVSPYLMVNETNASVAKEFFALNSTIYYIINISGTPTFLVKLDNLVLDKTEIESALKQYYSQKYSLSQNETNALRTDFITYNYSRNNGGRFKDQEENACRKALFLHLYPCFDNSSCYKTAQLVCAGYTQVTGCSDPEMFYPYIVSFVNASDQTTAMMNDIFNMFSTMTTDNIVAYLQKMKSYIPSLKYAMNKMESTPFRMPAQGEHCNNCYGICPDIDMDGAALDRADSKLKTFLTKVAPLANYQQTADKIFNNTQMRLLESEKADKRLYYRSIYLEIKDEASDVKDRAQHVLSLVDNATARNKLAAISAIESDIENMINSSNFDDLNSTLLDYKAAVKALNATVAELAIVYDNVSNISTSAAVYLFLIEGKASTPEEIKTLNVLREKKMLLDQQFKPGLTTTQYSDIQAQYAALVKEEKDFLAKKSTSPTQTFYMLADGMARKIIEVLDTFVNQVKPLTYLERIKYSTFLPTAVSLLLFFSFSSLLFFLFMFYYGFAARPMHKALLVILVLLLVFLVALFSMSMYLSFDKAYGKMEYSDFVSMVKSSKNFTLIIIKDGADNQTLSAMRTCASSVAITMARSNVTTKIYEMSDQTCYPFETNLSQTIQNSSSQQSSCLDRISGPIMLFNSSMTSSSTYTGLLVKQALFAGNSAFYSTCAPAEALKILK